MGNGITQNDDAGGMDIEWGGRPDGPGPEGSALAEEEFQSQKAENKGRNEADGFDDSGQRQVSPGKSDGNTLPL